MKILNGLDQNDEKKKKTKEDSKEIVKEIRTAYQDLGEIINGVEQDEGIKKAKKKEDEDEEEYADNPEKKKKKEDEKEEKEDKDKKKKDKDDEDDKKKKKKKGDNDDNDDDDDEETIVDYNPFSEDNEEPKRKKKKKLLTRKDHLQKVLSYIKKAETHLETIGGKRIKDKKQTTEEADTRSSKGTNWKNLATRLARQLGLVLKKMAEKDQKLMAERSRLQGVLATLAQIEAHRNEDPEGNTEAHGEDEEDDDGDENNDEDRSKIIHNMATKLLNFSKTVNEAQRNSHFRTPRRRKKVIHNLVSRYRNLVNKIMENWVKLKGSGKKKSGIPKQGTKSAKRGEIVRHKGNSTADTSHSSTKPVQTGKTAKKLVQSVKDAKKKSGIPEEKLSNTQTETETITDGEQDVLEVANK